MIDEYIHTYIDGYIDTQTDTQIHRQMDTQIDRYIDTQIDGYIDRWIHRQIHRQMLLLLLSHFSRVRRQPTRLPCPWDSSGKNTGVDCHFLLQCMKVKSESEVAQSCPTLSDPMDCSLPGSSAMGFSRQEYWSGVPLPSPLIGKKENSDNVKRL